MLLFKIRGDINDSTYYMLLLRAFLTFLKLQ